MEETIKKYFVYFLVSLKDGSYYIGVSNNYVRRFKEHNLGLSKSTRSKKPWKIVRVEKFDSIAAAYQREYFLKAKKSKKIIEKIINDGR
ncbi:MAG: GIY-YIG nuclease family protein [bacterium]|nr:GIY-YIG nuclease family protein [bacterium]